MPKHSNGQSRGGSRALLIVAIVIFLLGAGAFAYVSTGGFGSETTDAGVQAQDAATTDEGVEIKDHLEDYSWEELSEISRQMSAYASRDEALEVAKTYHLVNEDGSMTGETKQVTLDDGTVIEVALADVYHDAKADGSGQCGMTFVCMTCAGTHQMNDTNVIDGGWEACSMRSWLDTEMMENLPDDLASVIVSANKLTNNVGMTTDTGSVTSTSDRLWLLSAREVCGNITWYADEYGSWHSDEDAVFNAEGEQYALFAQLGVTCYDDPDDCLVRTSNGTAISWFLRTCESNKYNFMDDSYYRSVLDSGYPKSITAPSEQAGVVFGFCI
jgi:hypothetical protein